MPSLNPDANVAWSPGGTRIACTAGDTGNYALWIVGAAGTDPRLIHRFYNAPSEPKPYVLTLDWQPLPR